MVNEAVSSSVIPLTAKVCGVGDDATDCVPAVKVTTSVLSLVTDIV